MAAGSRTSRRTRQGRRSPSGPRLYRRRSHGLLTGMSGQSYLLVMLAFVVVGALPAMTLRHGRLTLGWWVTAAPTFLAPLLVLMAWTGVLTVDQSRVPAVRVVVLTVAALASVALVAFTAGSHRV